MGPRALIPAFINILLLPASAGYTLRDRDQYTAVAGSGLLLGIGIDNCSTSIQVHQVDANQYNFYLTYV